MSTLSLYRQFVNMIVLSLRRVNDNMLELCIRFPCNSSNYLYNVYYLIIGEKMGKKMPLLVIICVFLLISACLIVTG